MTIAGGNYANLAHSLAGRPPITTVHRTFETPSVEPTLDGYVGVCTNSRQQFDDFLLMIERPDLLVVDIDPPDGAFEAAVEVAFLMLDVLDDLGLMTLVKTTGGKGLHIVVPIVRHVSPEQLRRAATRLTGMVADRRPDLVTAEFRKASRKGRVMLDPSRNGTGATIVAPYSPRARAEATVSFPVLPDELRSIAPADFTVTTVPGRLDEAGPARWTEAARDWRQRLPASLLRE